MEAQLQGAGAEFSVLLAGDFNEDAFRLASTETHGSCALITSDLVVAKFAALGLNVSAACSAGTIGTATWDPTLNDLADRFSSNNFHQVLDYVIEHSTSAPAGGRVSDHGANVVHTAKTAASQSWAGTFCSSSMLGETGDTTTGSATALTDHNMVTARFSLPVAPSDGTLPAGVQSGFATVVADWVGGTVGDGACGQLETPCLADSNCCNGPYSWNGRDMYVRSNCWLDRGAFIRDLPCLTLRAA